jgi:NADH-quinone oxidoreductase subunit A
LDGNLYSSTSLWPLGLFIACAVAVGAVMIVLSYFLGERHKGRTTGEPYESGMPPTGPARMRFSIKYYLVAMFFVIFDVEAVFIFAWAVSVRELGWPGYVHVVIFIGVLLAALFYLSRLGALDWGGLRTKTEGRDGR